MCCTTYISHFIWDCFSSLYFQRCFCVIAMTMTLSPGPYATNKSGTSVIYFSFIGETALHGERETERESLLCTVFTPAPSHTPQMFFLFQKLLTMYSVFLASLLSSPKVSKNCSISLCSVALWSSAAALALSDSTILASTTWYQSRCWVRLVFSRTTSALRSSFLCSRLKKKKDEYVVK